MTWQELADQLYEAIQSGFADKDDLRGFLDAWEHGQGQPIDYYGDGPDDWPSWATR